MKHALILAAAIAVLFYAGRGTIIPGPYTYDEPDYMYAVSLGPLANAIDSPTLSLREFLKIGMGRGREAAAKSELSETIRESGDVVFYRHWHGPVYSDFLSVITNFSSGELSTREWNYVFPIAAAVLMYFGALWLIPGAGGQCAGILAVVLYLWSYPVVRSTELGPHQLFAMCAAAALLLLAKIFDAQESSPRRYWYMAVVVTAISFCVLEVALALMLTVLICGYLLRGILKADAAFAGRSIGLFLATVLVIWPAALVKLSFVKAYIFMAYLALFRRGAWGAGATIAQTWWLRVVESPVPWLLAAIGAVYFVKRWRDMRMLLPFAIFSVVMAAAIFPVKTDVARYALPVWPGLVLFAALSMGLVMAKWKPLARIASVALLSAAMLATSWPSLRSNLPRHDSRSEAMIALIRDRGLARKTLLVPHGDLPMLHYYFYGSHFRQYYEEAAIAEQIRAGGIDGVIDRNDPPRWIPTGAVR